MILFNMRSALLHLQEEEVPRVEAYLRDFYRVIHQSLRPEDGLFRLSGDLIAALMEMEGDGPGVQSLVGRIHGQIRELQESYRLLVRGSAPIEGLTVLKLPEHLSRLRRILRIPAEKAESSISHRGITSSLTQAGIGLFGK